MYQQLYHNALKNDSHTELNQDSTSTMAQAKQFIQFYESNADDLLNYIEPIFTDLTKMPTQQLEELETIRTLEAIKYSLQAPVELTKEIPKITPKHDKIQTTSQPKTTK